MRILIVNTSDCIGGAAIAANRLMTSLEREGADVGMLVLNKKKDNSLVTPIDGEIKKRYDFVFERFIIWMANHLSRKNLFSVSIANTGTDITRLPQFKEADVIHLHWINQGMLSLTDLEKILHSGKSIFWTMHDMWPVTGICHHADNCTKYKSECSDCAYLASPGSHDLANKVFLRKKAVYSDKRLVFVGCSQWLTDLARKSALTMGHEVVSIPNPIDTSLFCPSDRLSARSSLNLPLDKKLILFAAQKITNPMKGMDYLIKACRMLKKERTGLTNIGLVVTGTNTDKLTLDLPFDIYRMGYVSSESEMRDIYNAVDVFVTPSLLENLPNTIMESLACGLPCVGFSTGGIPEMIDHKQNGYIARYKSAEDLAEGIRWILEDADAESLASNARKKALTEYSMTVVAQRFLKLYDRYRY